MKGIAFFGFICPKCRSTIDIGASVSSASSEEDPKCPSCGTKMEPNPQGQTTSANVHCRNCNSSFGLINSDKCPCCGQPFSQIP